MMSIFFDFDIGPTGRRFRRAVDSDKYDIELFWKRESTEQLFGPVDLGELIELSTLSICMINENKDVIGFMALNDYPNVLAVDPADWEMWIRNMFDCFYLSRNTLFVHFICCKDIITEHFVEEAFVSVFDNDIYLKNIVLIVPTKCPEENYMRHRVFKKRNMYRYWKINGDSEDSQFLFTATRQEFCPKLKLRRAVEEDNDDIVDILDKSCPELKQLYGHYYISEIIGRHPEMNRTVIVLEDQERAVGVMCLNSDINYQKLQSTYELKSYHGLIKATPLEKEQNKHENVLLKLFGEPIMQGKLGPFDQLTKETISQGKLKEDNKTGKPSKVNFDHELPQQCSMRQFKKPLQSDDFSESIYVDSQTPSQTLRYSVADLLEGDAFEYDIVNIDDNLLTVPQMESVDREGTDKTQGIGNRQSMIKSKYKGSISISQRKIIDNCESTTICGEANAFMIELFGLRDDINDRHSFDLLEAAFEAMKTLDYCLIRVPCADKTLPLLQHFCYVPTKPDICCKYGLYIAHRSSVLGKLRVREAEFADIPQIAQFMYNIDCKETIWTIENNLSRDKKNTAYVFLSGFTIIGVAVLEALEQIDFIRAKYNLDSFHTHKYHVRGQELNEGLSALKTVLAYSVFSPHYRFFLRDIMRLTGNTALLWLTAYRNKWVAHKINTLASSMIPLNPRKSEVDCTIIKKITNLSNNIMAFSTWFIGKKLTSVPTSYVNTRIVVIGASTTAMGFLDTLLFSHASSYLVFTNVTLMSPHGLPYRRHSKLPAEAMFSKLRYNTDRYLKSIPYTYYVNVIHGTVVEINKEDNRLTLSNGSILYYDMLFLLIGKQYQAPDYFHKMSEWDKFKFGRAVYSPLDKLKLKDNFTTDEIPENVFIINTITDANKALVYVKKIFYQEQDYKIIVYGASINAYCCIATLLEMNLPSECIIFVEPFPPEEIKKPRIPVFCNVYVDQTITEVLNDLNVKVYRSYYFKSWTVNANKVQQVEFISQFKNVQLECSAFFYYGKRGINIEAFIAINKSGIGYDGGILIDNQFRTRDPGIYAAGPATRYYRRHYADSYRHKYYDSYEVGQKLGELIRNKLDPLFSIKTSMPKVKSERNKATIVKSVSFDVSVNSDTSNTKSSRSKTKLKKESSVINDDEKLAVLKKPIVICCQLPGKLKYLDVRSPGVKTPHHYVQSLEYNGFVMETFKGGYFKLHLTNDLIVDGITCLNSDKYSVENFKNLYGLSAIVLNNLHFRYSAKEIDDFYEFFRSPWAFFLYLDNTNELFAMIKELYPKDQNTLYEALSSVGEKLINPSTKNETKMIIRTNFENSPQIEVIINYVVEWLAENDVQLPMFLQPPLRVEFNRDLDRHPAFKRKKTHVAKLFAKSL